MRRGTDSLLVLLGSGYLEDSLRREVSRRGLEDRVRFLGHVDEADRYYRALDVFVLTSDEREAFGLVLLEAMLAEVPIVTSDAPGPLSVVADTARVFPAGDVVSLTAQLDDARDTARSAALARASHDRLMSCFSQTVFAEMLSALPPWQALPGSRNTT